MGTFICAVGAIGLFVAWLVLEFKQRKGTRIALGLLSTATIALTAWFMGEAMGEAKATMLAKGEPAALRASLRALGALLREGNIASAEKALAAYEAALQSTADTYEASRVLWQNLPDRHTVTPSGPE
jgi:hypothetical protein